MAKVTRRATLDQISSKTAEFLADRKNSNCLVDLIKLLEVRDVKVILAAIRAVYKICTHLISSGDLVRGDKPVGTQSEKEKIYLTWLRDRFSDCCSLLSGLLCHDNSTVQDLSLVTLMKFVKAECEAGQNQTFPVSLMQQIVKALLCSADDSTALIGKFQEYTAYDDVRYFTMKSVLQQLNADAANKDHPLNLWNTFALLQNLSMPEATDDAAAKNFYALADGGNVNKLASHKQHRKLFQILWLEFLKKQLPQSLYHKVLVVLDDKVMPYVTNPLQLSDFLTQSYNIGGATSLLALNGLFRLIHGYNLDYPDFYGKLYALLEPSVFHVKYRARFFFLLDLFLTSTHLPAYLVAAFIKRLSRLCLTAPPHGLTIVIPFIYNLILRHNTCRVLVHRPGVTDMTSDPYDPAELDLSKCHALDSSLWELKSLGEHYHHSIAFEAKKLEQPLPKQESDLCSVLDTNMSDLMTKEKKKKLKEVSKTFDVPEGLFGVQGSCMAQLWKWDS